MLEEMASLQWPACITIIETLARIELEWKTICVNFVLAKMYASGTLHYEQDITMKPLHSCCGVRQDKTI